MIKPPFTVFILKDSHQPVTIRVTKNIFLSILLMLIIFSGLAISGIIAYLPYINFDLVTLKVKDEIKESDYIFIEQENNINLKGGVISDPDVKNLAIQQLDEGMLEISFAFANIPDNKELLVWLILFDESDSATKRLIYPRSPIFRDLPVDYRNGIYFNPLNKDKLSATLSKLRIEAGLKRFRILAYSLNGDIIIDKLINI